MLLRSSSFWKGLNLGHVAALFLAAVVGTSLAAPKAFSAGAQALLGRTLASFGWFYLASVCAALVFMLYLAFGKHGGIRLGGPDAEPEFSTPSWFAMLFSAGMGIGLVFFGAAEPISHLGAPPEGLTPGTPEAASAAMRYTFFHYGPHPWAVYGLLGLAMAYFRFNHGKSGQISGLLEPLLGRRMDGPAGKLVDILAVVATVGGVATSLGYGAVSIAAGLERLVGVPSAYATQVFVIAVATVLFLLSSASGLKRGVKYLSNLNMALAGALLAAVLALGPTGFVFDTLTTSTGAFLDNLPGMSLRLTPFSGRTWVLDWTVFYWAWWISWAPFVGAFIAQISRGRTIREFVVGVLVVPSLFSFLWFSAFGGTAIHQELFAAAGLTDVAAQGAEGVLFAMLDNLPLGGVLSAVAVLLLMTFFVTSADSATLVVASMANGGKLDPGLRAKLLWGLLISGIAVALLGNGGLQGLQSGAVITALPFAIILCGVAASLLKLLREDHRAARELEIARRHAVDRMLRAKARRPHEEVRHVA